MKKLLSFLTIALLFNSCSELQVQQTMSGIDEALNAESAGTLSNADVIAGLKEALEIGAKNSAGTASALDGFWKNDLIKIPFPQEAIKVKNTLNDIGMGAQVEQFEMTLNRAAEDASKEAATIFVNAILSMSIQDGFEILNGGDHGATAYLQRTTTAQLEQKFTPVVSASIEKVELTKYWQPLATKYNMVSAFTGGEQVEPDLTSYVNARAIDGLFVLIAQEEEKIRKDPAAQVTELLKKVFGN